MTKETRDFEKENDRIFAWIGGIMSFIILVFLLLNEPWRDRGCFLNENSVYEKSFAGKVIEKYINYEYSATRMVVLEDKEKVPLIKKGYYEQIAIGDSIVKIKESFLLEIHKKDSFLILDYKYNCSDDH